MAPYLVGIIFLVLGTSASSTAFSQEEKFGDAFIRNEFVPPKIIERSPPIYPASRARLAQAGLVEIEMMVDETGKVIDPVAIRSTHPHFEKSALKSMTKYKMKPATYKGENVASRYRFVMTYILEGTWDSVNYSFSRRYRSIKKELALENPNQKKLRKLFKSINNNYGLSMYALAHVNLVEWKYAKQFLGKRAETKALEKLVSFESKASKDAKFIDDSERQRILIDIVENQINLGFYSEAIASYYRLKREFPEASEIVLPTIREVGSLLNSDQPYALDFETNQRGHEFVTLTNSAFLFRKTNGKINKLKLRCQIRSTELDYREESEYRIPSSWGTCGLQLIGKPASTGQLVQFKKTPS